MKKRFNIDAGHAHYKWCVASGLSEARLDPFIANMHVALWVLAATSVVGAGVSLLRPRSGAVPEAVPA